MRVMSLGAILHQVTFTPTPKTTGLDYSVAKSSANGLVDTEFASRYRRQLREGILRPLRIFLFNKKLFTF